MKRFNKKLAIEIFDWHFKKHGVSSLILYSREVINAVSRQVGEFGLDVVFSNDTWIGHSLYDKDYRILTFKAWKGSPTAKFIREHHKKVFKLDKFPDVLKVAVIKHCIKNHVSVNWIHLDNSDPIIPETESLEELAIMMDLER